MSDIVPLLFSEQIQPEDDVIGALPTEVVANIFRYLDGESLVSAAGVNFRWKSICSGDVILRRRIHRRLQDQRLERIQPRRCRRFQVTDMNPAVVINLWNGILAVQAKQLKKSNNQQRNVRTSRKRKLDANENAGKKQ